MVIKITEQDRKNSRIREQLFPQQQITKSVREERVYGEVENKENQENTNLRQKMRKFNLNQGGKANCNCVNHSNLSIEIKLNGCD